MRQARPAVVNRIGRGGGGNGEPACEGAASGVPAEMSHQFIRKAYIALITTIIYMFQYYNYMFQ